jgi:hypothetical protein
MSRQRISILFSFTDPPERAAAVKGPAPVVEEVTWEASFERQQRPLDLDAPPEAGERAVGADHPVAGNDDTDRVGGVGAADGAGGGGIAQAGGELTVAERPAVGDPPEAPPHRLLERCAPELHVEIEVASRSLEVLLNLIGDVPAAPRVPDDRPPQPGGRPFDRFVREENQPRDGAALVDGDEDLPRGRRNDVGVVGHGNCPTIVLVNPAKQSRISYL